eukprot:866175-Pelagomonas_calceolata.AAC.1
MIRYWAIKSWRDKTRAVTLFIHLLLTWHSSRARSGHGHGQLPAARQLLPVHPPVEHWVANRGKEWISWKYRHGTLGCRSRQRFGFMEAPGLRSNQESFMGKQKNCQIRVRYNKQPEEKPACTGKPAQY